MRSLQSRATITTLLCILVIAAALAVEFYGWKVLQELGSDELFDIDSSSSATTTYAVVFKIFLGSVGLAALAFLAWFHRAHANLAAAGVANLRYGSIWTIIGFIIPILSFFRPLQVLNEVSRSSAHLGAGVLPEGGRKAGPADPRNVIWWIVMLLASAAASLAAFASGGDRFDGGVQQSTTFAMIYAAVLIPAMLLLVPIVRRITAQQETWRTRTAVR